MFKHRWEKIVFWFLIGLYFLVLFIPNVSEADTVSLSWQNATQNTDGTAIPATGDAALDVTVLSYSECDPGDVLKPIRTTLEVPATVLGFTVEMTTPGDFCFAAYHRNVAGTWSALSNVAKKTVVGVPPVEPPLVDPKVIDTRAYSVAKIDDGFLLIVIGSVPLGTPCDINQTVNGKYAVPHTEVTFSGINDSGTVVADCG